MTSATVHAEWGVGLGTGGFQGEKAVAVVKDWSRRHAIEFGIGEFPLAGEQEYQLNLGYRFTPWQVRYYDVAWSPLGVGVVALYALDQDEYFVESPDKYPSPDYYEQTGLRLGVEVSTQMMAWADRVRLLYKVVLLDTGITSYINNDGKYAENFYSSGLFIEFFF
ncbi:MAG: hypothetical protein AB7P49_07270 [Bdellovibrionales bacterium]